MKIWLVSKFEQTPVDKVFSTRFLSIADEAQKRGHEITFIGSTFKHNTKNQRFAETTEIEHKPGYHILFVQSNSYMRNISLRRLWVHYIFGKQLIKELEVRPRPGVILMAFPPVSVAYELSEWAKAHGIPTVMDIIDPWPDTFSMTFPSILRSTAKLLLGLMRKRLQMTLGNIQALTAISQQYIDWAGEYQKKIPSKQVFYPAVDLSAVMEAVDPWRKKSRSQELTVIYAGSLASSYDIPCILKAAAIVGEKYPDISFRIAGTGPQASLIKDYQNAHENLIYLGRLPKDELMKHYAESHLGLTQHIIGASQSVTYKLFDLLAAGLPILNSLESEMKEIILNNEVGLHNSPGDSRQLAENIIWFYNNPVELQRYRNNGYQLTRESGDAAIVYKRFVDLLEKTAAVKLAPSDS